MRKIIVAGLILLLTILNSWSQQLAFPSAEGFGKYTVGGRGGAVYEVTNLNATGTGSLGAAIAASGPRTVVFRVSGTITGNFNIKNDNITIAGQTAPGDGICIKGNLSTSADNVIIRYIRVRWDPSMGENDGIGGRYQKNIIFDHVSASWSTDETMTLYHNENTTVQWCIIAEACPKGTTDEHRFGGIWGNNYGTWHHNLIAHNASRNPRWASGCGYNDYRNNVIYNWEYASCYGAEAHQPDDRRNPKIEHSTINMIANYYKPGPATEAGVRARIADPSTRTGDADAGKWWVSGNVVEGYPTVTADNWKGVTRTEAYFRLSEPWDAMPINQQTAEEAFQSVLDHAGCSLPMRDKVDADIIDDVLHGTAKYGNNGIIDSPSDVGGWPPLVSGPPPADSDHDGMADNWETENGLDPNNPDDRNIAGTDGYTMLENYLNSLAGYTPVSVSGITFESARDTVVKDKEIRLYPIFSPVYASNQAVSWNSTNATVASVNNFGIVSGIDSGSAIITATTEEGGFVAECTVEVIIRISVTGVSIDPANITLDKGNSIQLIAIIEPSNADDKSVSWQSSNPFVAHVSSDGYLQAMNTGSAIITVTTQEGKYKATCNVDVPLASALDQKSSEDKIRVYPNPFTNEICIAYEGLDHMKSLEVLNITGQVVMKLNKDDLKAGFVELNLDAPGNFFLIRMNTDKKVYTKKIIRK